MTESTPSKKSNGIPPGRRALGYGFSLTDHLSGVTGALASLEALEHRDPTGHGPPLDPLP